MFYNLLVYIKENFNFKNIYMCDTYKIILKNKNKYNLQK